MINIYMVYGLREEIINVKHYRCRALIYQESGLPIIFLHGYSFTSDVWRDINVLNILQEKKIPFLALDMPYGARSGCSPKTRDPMENVRVLYEAIHAIFGSIEPLIVGASLGGYIALKYAIKYSVAALLLIAPVHVFDKELTRYYHVLKIPVHVIYGSRDDVVDKEDLEEFVKQLPIAKLIIYEDAHHPAYLDKPEEFKKDLLNLYNIITGIR